MKEELYNYEEEDFEDEEEDRNKILIICANPEFGKTLINEIKKIENNVDKNYKIESIEECDKLIHHKESWTIKTKYYTKSVEFWVFILVFLNNSY